jgi:hypothetical protein
MPNLNDPIQRNAYWTKVASDQLLGKKIVVVRYMTQKEADELGWGARPIVIQLDDGNIIYPSQDDEGNGPGSIFTNNKENFVLPVIW